MIINDFKKSDENKLSEQTIYFIISTFLSDLESESILKPSAFHRRFAIACLKHLSYTAFIRLRLTTQLCFSLFNDNCNSRKIVEYRKQVDQRSDVWFHIEKR